MTAASKRGNDHDNNNSDKRQQMAVATREFIDGTRRIQERLRLFQERLNGSGSNGTDRGNHNPGSAGMGPTNSTR